jgi:hypothetical protein
VALLLILEICMRQSRRLGGAWSLKVPVRSRLAPLSPEAQAVMALASIISREFSFELLLAASGLVRDTLLTTLGRLATLRFVDPAGFGLRPTDSFTHSSGKLFTRTSRLSSGGACTTAPVRQSRRSMAPT